MKEQEYKKLYKERKAFLRSLLHSKQISLAGFEKSMNSYREFLKQIKNL